MGRFFSQYLSFVKRMIPEKEVKSLVGIDIGVSSCKMVELKKNGNTYELVNWAIESNGDDAKQAVRKVLAKLKNPTEAPTTSVSGKGTLIRYIDMPRMSLDEIRKSFSYEADKYFPFPSDQIYTDCYILDTKGKENKVEVLVAAAKKELVDQRVKMLTELGLQADFIGLNSIAIANVLNELGLPEAETKAEDSATQGVAILDVGEVVSNLTILVNRVPRFTRDIFLGGKEFTKSIGHAAGVNPQEAEELKTQVKEESEPALNASDSVISNLVSELRLSFDYFVTEKNVQITQLLLTGGGSMLSGLTEVLSKQLEVPVQIWNPLQSLKIADAAAEAQQQAQRLGVALGLALYH